MKASLYIGRVRGIKIFIHWTFLILVAWILIDNLSHGYGWKQGAYSLLFILSVFVCITLHELGHALVAKHYKFSTRDIILLPIGGMARMDELPEEPRQELAIAIAGPIVNLVIALLLYPLVFWLGKVPSLFTVLFTSGDTFLFNLLAVNFFLAVFNLLPAFPMDGGRIFRALLSFYTSRVRATAIAARTGQVIALLFFFTGILYNPFLAVVGVFVFLMAQAENDYVRSRHALHDYHVKDVVMRKYHTLDANRNTVADAVNLLLDVQATEFLVMDNEKVAGTLNRDMIIRALSENKKDSRLAAVMDTKVRYLDPDMPLEKIYNSLKEGMILPVIQDGRLIGVVDLANILELILVKTAAEKLTLGHGKVQYHHS